MRFSRLALAAGLLGVSCSGAPEPPAPVVDEGPAAATAPPVLQAFDLGADFELPAHDGTVFDLAARRGEVFLLFFGYTHCPDFCPATLSLLAQAYDRLGPEGASVQTLMISVDPARDTPEALSGYLGYFAVPALGLIGSPEQTETIVSAYAGLVEPGEVVGDNQIFGHTTFIYLLDHEGSVRYLFRPSDSPEFIAAGIAEQLRVSGLSDDG